MDASTGIELRTPYPAKLRELLGRLGHTEERRALLDGLLKYRAELLKAGVVAGFQWIDGSFCEDVEATRKRPPADIDVVTFYQLEPGRSQKDLAASAPDLVRNAFAKRVFHVDAFLVELGTAPSVLARKAAYWSGQFGHTRVDLRWKGMLDVPLADPDDLAAEMEWRSGALGSGHA